MRFDHTVKKDGRLSAVLKGELGMSTGLMNRLKWSAGLLVNGLERRTSFPVRAGDVITVILDEQEPEYPAENLPLRVLYEDEHILAVDKPAGMLIHPSRNRNTGTLANAVTGYYRSKGERSAFHPVTRLDRDTYGVVLLGKTSYAHGRLSDLHTRGLLRKVYEAAVFGSPPEPEGLIDAPIRRRELPSLLRYIDPEGKPSQTKYQVLEKRNGYSLMRLWPLTGRTHQLRLHCAYIGCPILGDPQYASENSARLSEAMGLEHQLLCAAMVEFDHPVTGEHMQIRSKMNVMHPEKA